MFDIFTNLDLLSVGVIIATIGILGFIVFFNNVKSITNRTFLGFCLLTIVWGTLNYLTYQIHTQNTALWLLRFSICSAVWHSMLLFQLLYVFPKEQVIFPKSYKRFFLPIVALTSVLNLTPFTFNRVLEISSEGRVVSVQNGPGIVLFSTVIFALIISAIWIFIKKIKSQKDITPKQVRPILFGIIITFVLILVFNFIFPAFLNNSKYISFGAFFVFPFILGSGYSIFKHQFLNIKIISTEILTLILAVVILLQVVTAKDFTNLVFSFALFILVLTLGILLIKSVRKEVEQRERLEILDKELELANKKLKALDLARAEFITIASHQLRTPPATVKWYLSAVLGGDYGVLPPDTKEPIEKAQRTNNGLISLIDDMLNVSRIERGKMEFLFQETNVEVLAKEVFEQLMPIAKQKNLELQYVAPTKPLPRLMADKEKLKQVMNNIVDNALKYTKQGTVEMRILEDGGNIRFEVKDSGKGFDEEEENAIFEKYMRGKGAENHSAGLGLGMYVGKAIIDQHHGKIWAESGGVGKGSTFIFTIPIQNNLKATTLLDLSNPGRIEPS